MSKRVNLMKIYRSLSREFGPQGWWPVVGKTSSFARAQDYRTYEIMIGAILTQNTAWKNVERAIGNLIKARTMDPQKIARMPSRKLERLIRPAGYFRQKAKKLKIFSKWYLEKDPVKLANTKTRELRKQLLNLWGIGPETADSILLYALGRPVFVVDAYTRRLPELRGLKTRDYHDIQKFFMDRLPRSAKLFNEFHALIVAWGKTRSLRSAREDKHGYLERS